LVENWKDIRLPWYDQTPQSPNVDEDFQGITIWAPERVSLAATSKRIPLFGVVQLTPDIVRQIGVTDGHPLRAVVVGIIIGKVNTPFVGNAVTQAPLFPLRAGRMPREYFAVDLPECTGMPRGPGVFFVFASVGPFAAEPRRVEVVV